MSVALYNPLTMDAMTTYYTPKATLLRYRVLPLLVALTVALGPYALAQNNAKPTSGSVFWEITGNGLSQPSYLFGTIHFLEKKDLKISKALKDKLKSCELFSTETLFNHHTRHELHKGSHLPDHKSLEDYMEPADYKKLEDLFLNRLKVKHLKFNLTYRHLKPVILSITMTRLGLNEEVGYFETDLIKLAKANDMHLLGLETIEREMQALNTYPLDDQVTALVHNVENYDKLLAEFKQLVNYWKQGDLDKVFEITLEPAEDNEAFHRNFFDKRNEEWILSMNRYMGQAPTFFAVGAAHLAGEFGLIQLLRNEGYTVKPLSL